MTLRFWTSSYRYAGPDRIDVTAVGVARAIQAGKDAPGRSWAPSPKILWPAKHHLDLVAALERRAIALTGTEPGAAVAIMATELLAKVEHAYRDAYVNELRQSYRAHRPAWQALLARDEITCVCFCARREPGEGQRHTCHRAVLASVLVKLGAVDMGERELPPPATTRERKPAALPPLEKLVAVSGTRPPKPDAPREAHELHRRILADVAETVASLPQGSVVIHGGARGVDEAAGGAAKKAGHGQIVYEPWYDAWSRAAPTVRNAYVATAPRCIAWPSAASVGTVQAIGLARKAGVDVDERRLG